MLEIVTIFVVCGLQVLQKELQDKQAHQASLQTLWSQLQPEDSTEESNEAREKLHVTGSKLKLLLKQVDGDLSNLRQRLVKAQNIFFLHIQELS